MKLAIYQHNITKAYTDRLKEVGPDGDLGEHELNWKITRDVAFWGSESWEPMMASKYKMVGEMEVTDMSEVFHLGNGYGDQTKLNRTDDMRSLSVGDLVEDVETGELFMCDPEGWTSINYMGLQAPHQFGEVA